VCPLLCIRMVCCHSPQNYQNKVADISTSGRASNGIRRKALASKKEQIATNFAFADCRDQQISVKMFSRVMHYLLKSEIKCHWDTVAVSIKGCSIMTAMMGLRFVELSSKYSLNLIFHVWNQTTIGNKVN